MCRVPPSPVVPAVSPDGRSRVPASSPGPAGLVRRQRCPAEGLAAPALQQPGTGAASYATPAPPFDSTLSFFPSSEVCVLLQII